MDTDDDDDDDDDGDDDDDDDDDDSDDGDANDDGDLNEADFLMQCIGWLRRTPTISCKCGVTYLLTYLLLSTSLAISTCVLCYIPVRPSWYGSGGLPPGDHWDTDGTDRCVVLGKRVSSHLLQRPRCKKLSCVCLVQCQECGIGCTVSQTRVCVWGGGGV